MFAARLIFLCGIVLHSYSFAKEVGNKDVVDSLQIQLKKNPNKAKKFDILTELAWYTRLSNPDKARTYCNEALKIADETRKPDLKAVVYNTLGHIEKDKGRFNEAMSFYLKSLRIQDSIGNKKSISAGYINISNIHYYTNNIPKALEYLQKALQIKRELKDDNGIAGCLNNIANILMNTGKDDSALTCFKESLEIRRKLGNKHAISASLANLGQLHSKMEQPEMAIPFFESAIEIKQEIGDSIGLISSFVNAGRAYHQTGNRSKARIYFDKGLAIGKIFDAKDDYKNALTGLASLNYDDQRFKDAYNNLEEYIAVNDSIINEEVTKSQAEMSAKYETEKKEKEIALLNKDKLLQEAEIQQQRTFRNLSMAVGFLVTTLAGALFFAFRQKHKSNLLLSSQKIEILEKNSILTLQKEEIQIQKKEITDSINYAKRIQDSILPSEEEMLKGVGSGFILYKPKDIVSGDFYWCYNTGNESYIVAADSTGHGVPGALMSMIGAEKLAGACKEEKQPGKILESVNENIRTALKQNTNSKNTGDGMDLALIKVDKNQSKIFFAGANRPLWVRFPGESIHEFKGNKLSIGGSSESGTKFQEEEIEYKKGTRFYLFSDGFADQFGGNDGKKLMKKNFRIFIESIQNLSMSSQKEELERFFETWRGNHEQVDDVMVIGIEA